ncbi:hypothetical protein D3C76_1509630 [compost metagenome]
MGGLELSVFIDAIPGIAPGVAHDPGVADPVIEAAMGMAMQPECRLPRLDPLFEV